MHIVNKGTINKNNTVLYIQKLIISLSDNDNLLTEHINLYEMHLPRTCKYSLDILVLDIGGGGVSSVDRAPDSW